MSSRLPVKVVQPEYSNEPEERGTLVVLAEKRDEQEKGKYYGCRNPCPVLVPQQTETDCEEDSQKGNYKCGAPDGLLQRHGDREYEYKQ